MSVETTFDPERHLILIRLEGSVNVKELIASYDALFPQAHFQPNMHAVWDLSRFDLKGRSVNEVRDLVRELRKYAHKRGDHYKAALVTSRAADYQLLRIYLAMLKLVGSQVTLKLFQNMEDAYEWIERK